MTGMLASVASLAEARVVAECGVAIIDLKNPAEGALGALPVDRVVDIVNALNGMAPISATVGDLPMRPEWVQPAVTAMAATRVDYVKLGFFPGGDWAGVMASLEPLARRGVRLIAVCFADHPLDLAWLPELSRAGFAGAMLDTADKQGGALTQRRDLGWLGDFVASAHRAGLLCGLAGSLRAEDIAPLHRLGPDYLGFRGALCGGNRTAGLDPIAVSSLLRQIRTASSPLVRPEVHHALPTVSPRTIPDPARNRP
jgi:(5-formylfuran-3-yl)methyl phosphate synthase